MKALATLLASAAIALASATLSAFPTTAVALAAATTGSTANNGHRVPFGLGRRSLAWV